MGALYILGAVVLAIVVDNVVAGSSKIGTYDYHFTSGGVGAVFGTRS